MIRNVFGPATGWLSQATTWQMIANTCTKRYSNLSGIQTPHHTESLAAILEVGHVSKCQVVPREVVFTFA